MHPQTTSLSRRNISLFPLPKTQTPVWISEWVGPRASAYLVQRRLEEYSVSYSYGKQRNAFEHVPLEIDCLPVAEVMLRLQLAHQTDQLSVWNFESLSTFKR
jgi:hypothetical protein